MEIITFLEIHEQTKLSRTTIKRRVLHLNLKVYYKKSKRRPQKAIDKERLKDLIDFNYFAFRTEKELDEKADKKKHKNKVKSDHFSVSKMPSFQLENRANGLYHRLTPYGGIM